MRQIIMSTTMFWPCTEYWRKISLLPVIFPLMFLVLSFPVVGHAQKLGGPITVPRNFNKQIKIAQVDYFRKDIDPYVKNDIFQRERDHMGREFWDAVRGAKFQRALDDLDFVLRYVPNHPKALSTIGFISRVGKNPVIANLYYQRALQRFPQHALTHAQYGAYLADIGKVNEGIARLQKATAMDPNLVSAHLWLAKVYVRVGKKDLARQAVERANAARAGGRAAPGDAPALDMGSLPTGEEVLQ